ncbi:hypothetical protein HDU96_006677 [Phlyctochytrium bullatum]|nr:hypothetical protein HDU96_006677 [Phlyctochytrium bullatum]
MVQPIVHLNDSTADCIVSALSEVQARWPEIKMALEAKKAVDDAFKSAVAHEARAFDLSKEITDLEAKSNPIGDLLHSRKKKLRELRAQMDQELRTSTAADSRAVEMSQQFLNHKAAYDVLESQMSKYLAVIADLPETAKRLEALKISRGAFDLAKSRYPNYKKAEALCVEVLEESKHTRDRLMEEYSGEGFERCSVEGAQAATHLFYNIDAHVDMKAQKEAISSSNIAAQKSNKIFELCPELPPHTIEPKNLIDPKGPAAQLRKPAAVAVQNAVIRLDAYIDNHEVTLAHIRKELTKFRGDLIHEVTVVAEAVVAIWDATVPPVVGRMGEGGAKVEEMRKWMPDVALSTNAFKL